MMRSNFLTPTIAVATLISCIAVISCAVFGQAEQAQIAQDSATIFTCQTKGREAGTYKAYDDCMVEAGERK